MTDTPAPVALSAEEMLRAVHDYVYTSLTMPAIDRHHLLGFLDSVPVAKPPIYCTGGCDACRDYARELGVPLIVPSPHRD